jgi:hypothetical protein
VIIHKYSGGQVIKVIKSVSGKRIYEESPEVKKELWGGEVWIDRYYIATISDKGNKGVIEKYIRNQGRENDIGKLRFLTSDALRSLPQGSSHEKRLFSYKIGFLTNSHQAKIS